MSAFCWSWRRFESCWAAWISAWLPPTFLTVADFTLFPTIVADPYLGLDSSRVIHGDQEHEWPRPPRVGQALAARARSLGVAAGPTIGGFITQYLSWRWIFYVNVPIGVIGFIFSWLFLEEHTEPLSGDFDFWGFVLSGAGLSLLAVYSGGNFICATEAAD